MVTWASVEVHAARLVKSLETNVVVLILLLLLHGDHIAAFIPVAEPLGLAGHNHAILLPHPEAENIDTAEALLVLRYLSLQFVVDLG